MDKATFLATTVRLAESVWDFHRRFGVPQAADETVLLSIARDRLSIQTEEVGEFARAINKVRTDDIVLEAADVAYVALGSILSLGDLAVDAAWRVAEKNDGKSPSGYRTTETGKVVKQE